MPEQFTSQNAVNAAAGYDASTLKGRSVVVTGGASGMGEEMTRQFVKAGAFVTIGDLSTENGNKIVSELGEENTAFAQCNVNTWSDQVNMFKTAVARSPSKSVDVVIANAGISGADSVWRDDAGEDGEPIEPDLKIIQTNLISVMYTAKLAVHYLNRNGEGNDRCLILTASIAGYMDQPGSPQYSASKWGVRGVMRSLRRTMPTMGMRVNIIAPWFVRTAIMSKEVQDLVVTRGITFADKADAGAAVVHMASDKSINGRSCCIVPRDVAPQGYKDIEGDDDAEGNVLAGMQGMVMNASHRMK